MNTQQQSSHAHGAYVAVASGTIPHNGVHEEPQTSSTEDMSDQSQDSLTLEVTTTSDKLYPIISGGNPLSTKPQFDIASIPSQCLDNGTKTFITEEDRRKEHKKRSKNWTRAETLSLINARRELDHRFRRTGKKAALWEEIAYSVQQAGFSRDGQQCKDKWEKLTAGYKEVRDGVREKDDYPFYEELHPLLSWKVCKKESDTLEDGTDCGKRLKFEIANGFGMPSWKYVGMPLGDMTDGRTPRERMGYDREEPASPGKRKHSESISFIDLTVIQDLLDTVVARQQKFFKEILDAVDRKEQLREQMRHDREEKWRAEERAQRSTFNNAMILLIERLLGERRSGLGTAIVPAAPPVMIPPLGGGLASSKKRSKNWKKSEVFNLIRCRREMECKFAKSMRRASLWEELGEKLGGLGIKRDGKQCREKWDKLMAEYKDVLDGKKEREDSPYFAELFTFVGKVNEVVEGKSSPETAKKED